MTRPFSESASLKTGYDVIVIAGNPGGIACAIRCAREGLSVLIVERTRHLGGMWASGVQVLDTRYEGRRCPVLSEFIERVARHYGQLFGPDSPEHRLAQFGDPSQHGQRPRFEPHVAERVFQQMLDETPGVSVAFGYEAVSVSKEGRTLRTVTLSGTDCDDGPFKIAGKVFVDASYEADLAALAGATFHIGREAGTDFGEPHAGVNFTTIEPIGEIGETTRQRLHLHFFNRTSRTTFAASTHAGDGAIQAYTARLILTDRPENRRAIEMPAGYARERYAGLLDRGPDSHTKAYPLSSHYLDGPIEHLRFSHNLQNCKMDWLGANLVGGNHGYPLAGNVERRRIYQAHLEHALGMLYFLQNDAEVPETMRNHAREWGLARDEFADNDNLPYLMYVRECRRLDGLYVFTELDASKHNLHQRSPIHTDSIAIAEWPMDSHDCNAIRERGSFNDGEFILADETLPSQVPYRCMLTAAADNLLVAVSMSATHVGWGTLRLETVFVHTGEAAGVAAAMSVRSGTSVHQLNPSDLQWELLRRGIVVTYFADIDLGLDEEWQRAAQYLGARGFFDDYDLRPDEFVGADLEEVWKEMLSQCSLSAFDPNEAAGKVALVRNSTSQHVLTTLTVRDACVELCNALRTSSSHQ